MRCVGAVLFLVLVSMGCGQNQADPIDEALARINGCEILASAAGRMIITEREFTEMQRIIAESGEATLGENHALMLRGMREVTVVGLGKFEPDILGEIFEPGVTSWQVLLEHGGIREVFEYSVAFSRLFEDDDLEFSRRYADELEWECAARDAETIEYLCFEDPDPNIRVEACRAWENIPTRDLAIIAEACEQVPYLVFCDPEDPPPWLPPNA